MLIDQGQPAALEDTLAQQYNLQRLNGQTVTLIAARAQLYAIPDGRTVAAVVSVLAADARVRLAQGNFAYRRQGETGKGQAAVPQYALSKISIAPAHEMALGRGVRIAVINSAIDAAHPDLAGVVLKAFDATNRAADTSDAHGTAVAGIIGARGAVRGVAPMAEILAVRAFAPLAKQQPIASSSVILLRAIEWSVVNGAQVLNMSFVGPRDPAVQAMIEAAQKRNAVVVAAAGNGGSSAPPAYPAAYPGVIAVTAVDATDKRYVHANRGKYIAISAPGVDILAPADGGRHAFLSGTSFAAAHVSGIVALLLERSRSLQPEGALAALSENAVDLGPAGRDEDFGFGRADAFAALAGAGGKQIAERRRTTRRCEGVAGTRFLLRLQPGKQPRRRLSIPNWPWTVNFFCPCRDQSAGTPQASRTRKEAKNESPPCCRHGRGRRFHRPRATRDGLFKRLRAGLDPGPQALQDQDPQTPHQSQAGLRARQSPTCCEVALVPGRHAGRAQEKAPAEQSTGAHNAFARRQQ